jgi:hypothetical protein
VFDEAEGASDRREEVYSRFIEEADVIWKSTKILALTVDAPFDAGYEGSAEPFGRGWGRARMWDQYAEKHKGVCLVFDRAALTARIADSLAAQNLDAPYNGAVQYSREGPSDALMHIDLNTLDGQVTAAVMRTFVKAHNDKLFFLKTSDWETEFEYRFVVIAPGCHVDIDYGDALKGVVLGHQFPSWQQARAMELCRDRNVSAHQVNWTMGCPTLLPLEAGG